MHFIRLRNPSGCIFDLRLPAVVGIPLACSEAISSAANLYQIAAAPHHRQTVISASGWVYTPLPARIAIFTSWNR